MNNFTYFYYTRYIKLFLFLYIIILSFYHLTNSSVFKNISNALAFFTVGYSTLVLFVNFYYHGIKKLYFYLCIVLVFSFLIHILINLSRTDYVDVIKLYSIFIFSFIGLGLGWKRIELSKYVYYFLFFSPLIIEILGGSRVYTNGVEFGFFPNSNTAVMYYVVIVSIFISQYEKPDSHAAFFLVIGLLFQKLGAMLSIFTSALFVFRKSILKYWFVIFIAGLLGVLFSYWLGMLDRIIDVLTGIIYLLYHNSLAEISDMSYAEIIKELGTTDLSAVFRLKHWAEILSFYSSQDLDVILFGYGARYTIEITTEGLMPHSDIIRVLCEMGLVIFILFMTLYYKLYKGLNNKHLKLSLLVVFIYYFSENLIDNFISMYLLHLMVGAKDNETNYGK